MPSNPSEFDDELPTGTSPLNRKLHDLARRAQREPNPSPRRAQYISRLLMALQNSGELARPQSRGYVGFYDDIYGAAWSMTAEYLASKIDDYDPKKGSLLHLANRTLRFRFNTAVAKFFDMHGAPKNFEGQSIETTYGQEAIAQECNDSGGLWDELVQFVEEDPDGKFRSIHLPGKPEATWQAIFLMRRDNYRWREIAERYDTKITTAKSFLDRNTLKLRDYIRDYFQSV